MTADFGDPRLPERFWSKVTVLESGCWPFDRLNAYGYGEYKHEGKTRGAHRVIWQVLVGKIPDGLVMDHLCRRRNCVNPAHLEPVTSKVNTLRGEAPSAKFARATHCIRGHEFTEENMMKCMLPYRKCRECNRQSSAAVNKAKREAAKAELLLAH